MNTLPVSGALSFRNLIIEGTMVSATSEANGYWKNRLLDPLRARRWRSTANTLQQLVGAFLAGIYLDDQAPLNAQAIPYVLGLVDSNLSENTNLDLATVKARSDFWIRADEIFEPDLTDLSSLTTVDDNAWELSADSGKTPRLRESIIDDKNVIRFDGGDVLYASSAIDLDDNHVINFLIKFISIGATIELIGGAGANSSIKITGTGTALSYTAEGGQTCSFTTGFVVGTTYLLSIRRSGLQVKLYKDKVLVSTGTLAGGSGADNFKFKYIGGHGATPTNPFNGDLAEMFIAYEAEASVLLSATDVFQNTLDDYLVTKWHLSAVSNGSVVFELGTESTFTRDANTGKYVLSYMLQPYLQGDLGMLMFYPTEPDSFSSSGFPMGPYTHWRLSLPNGEAVNAYHELGNLWFGEYINFRPSENMAVQPSNPSVRVRSPGGAPYIDVLPLWEGVTFDVEGKTTAEIHILKKLLRGFANDLGVVDLHANQSNAIRAGSQYYCLMGERRPYGMTIRNPVDNKMTIEIEEVRG